MSGKERIMRIAAAALAVLLCAGYFFLPAQHMSGSLSNSGRTKAEVTGGETLSWDWTPRTEDAAALEIRMSGLKKAVGMRLFAELRDGERTAASAERTVTEESLKTEEIRLEGRFEYGKTYTLLFRAEGEGTLKLRGEENGDSGEFYPLLYEVSRKTVHNPTLLYFALGLAVTAAVPVFREKSRAGRRRRRAESFRERESFPAAALPWAALAICAAVSAFILAMKPEFLTPGSWETWNEDAHWNAIKMISAGNSEGIWGTAAFLKTWHAGYIPQLIGYNLARIFTANERILYLTAGGCSAAAYSLLCAAAVKHAPRFKAVFLAAGTMPAFLFQAGCMVYDPTAAGCILLGLAMTLESMERQDRMKPERGIALIAMMAFGTAALPDCSLILLSLTLIPKDRFGGAGKAWLFRGTALFMMLWCLAGVLMPGTYEDLRTGDDWLADGRIAAQMEALSTEPANWWKPLEYVWNRQGRLALNGISQWGIKATDGTLNHIWMWILLLAAPLCTAGEDMGRESLMTPGRRITLGAIAWGSQILTAWAVYLVMSDPGGAVNGMQPRLFMPLWIALALAATRSHGLRKKTGRIGEWLAVPVALACLGLNIWYAIARMTEYGIFG